MSLTIIILVALFIAIILLISYELNHAVPVNPDDDIMESNMDEFRDEYGNVDYDLLKKVRYGNAK